MSLLDLKLVVRQQLDDLVGFALVDSVNNGFCAASAQNTCHQTAD